MNPSLRAALLGVTLVVGALFVSPGAQSPPAVPGVGAIGGAAGERVDLDAIYKIKSEGLERSQVMDTVWYLTDVYGPRLTNSPNIRAAAAWATKRMTEWGLSNPRLEAWGPFGRGWTNEKFTAQRRDAAAVPAHRVRPGVDAWHQRRDHRRGRPGHRRSRSGLQQAGKGS